MPILIPALLLGLGAAGLGWAALSKRVAPSGGAVSKDLAKRVANQGPRGEWVFKPELAESLVKSLSGQMYQYVDVNLDDTVTIAPDPRGQPIAISNTAMAWARQQNPHLSILAPLYMATATAQKRFLRAVKSGQEQDYTGPETGYAVLLYAGAIDRGEAPPGRPPGGGAITPIPDVTPTVQKTVPDLPRLPPPGTQPPPGGGGPLIPTFPPGGFPAIPSLQPGIDAATAALRGTVSSALNDLCANGQDPTALEAVATQAAQFGFTAEAACLRARAAQLRAQQQVVPPPPPPPDLVPTPVIFRPPPQPGQPPPFQPPAPPPVPTPPPFQPPAPPPVVPPPVLTPQFARVTTRDPPPSGDLILRATPSMQGPVRRFPQGTGSPNQIGGAEKDRVVSILSKITAEGIDWAEVQWNGGTGRAGGWPAARGFAKAQFLVPTNEAPTAPAPLAFGPGGVPFFPGQDVAGPAQGIPAGTFDPGAGVFTIPEVTVFGTPAPAISGRHIPHGQSVKTGALEEEDWDEEDEEDEQESQWSSTGASVRDAFSTIFSTVHQPSGISTARPVVKTLGRVVPPVKHLGRVVPPTRHHRHHVNVGALDDQHHDVVHGEGRAATVVSSSGMRLRQSPGPQGRTLQLVPAGTRVSLLQVAPGPRADPRSPGPGGWALVDYDGHKGWVQSEWLLVS